MKCKFRNLKTIEDKTFEADTFIEVLNLVSQEWFGGTHVIDWVGDNSSKYTLLSNAPNGNVIGTVYLH